MTTQLDSVPPAPDGSAPSRLRVERRTSTHAAVSLDEMVRLTGVNAERLRTWERRFGFPTPHRTPNGRRWFEPDDVRRVIAVSEAQARGVLLEDAIASATDASWADTDGGDEVVIEAEATIGLAPTPALMVEGGRSLVVLWCNSMLRTRSNDLREGVDLLTVAPDFEGSPGHAVLREVLNGRRSAGVAEHDDWTGPLRSPRRSWTWRVAAATPGRGPRAVLLQLPDDTGGAPLDRTTGSPNGRLAGPSADRAWAGAVAAGRDELRAGERSTALRRSLATTTRRIGASDGIFATYAAGTLLAARSLRGTIEAHAVDLGPSDPIGDLLLDGVIDWLGPQERARLGIPARYSALMIPVLAPHEPVGAIGLLFREELPLGDVARELLSAYANVLALAVICSRAPGLSAS